MANQPGRRQPFRFWYWSNPTPAARPPAPSRRPAARAPPRTPPPPPAAATPSPSRRPSKQSPTTSRSPSPAQEASQPPKEAALAPPLSTPPVTQPESPTKKPVQPQAQASRPTVEALSQTTKRPQTEFPSRPEALPSETASQPLGAASRTAQVSEPETSPVATVLGTTATQEPKSETESKEVRVEKSVTSEEESKKELQEKPQIGKESKQDSEPSQPPPVEEKPQIDRESKQDSQPSQPPPAEQKPQIDTESKQDSESREITFHIPQVEGKSTVQPETPRSHVPQDDEKPEEIKEEKPKKVLEVIKRTEHGESIEETQPSQIPREEGKAEEIIDVKPKADLEVIKKTEPRSPKSETASEENKTDEPETKQEAQPAETSTSSGDESDPTEIQSSINAESDSEAPGPHPGASELIARLRSSMERTNLNDSKGRKSTTGTRSIIPWALPSHGEQAILHKEIDEGISRLVQKLKLGQSQQLGSEGAVSIITLAGENNGATMFAGHETTKKESVLRIYEKPEASGGDKETLKRTLSHTDSENRAITASINSNVQGINNSLLHESSSSEEDPGVHLVLSIKPNEPAKSKGRAESSAASTAPAQ